MGELIPDGVEAWGLSGAQVAALLAAVIAVGREVRLERVLRRVVESATDLVGARYGALGILDAGHDGLADFLYVGIDEDTADAIGSLPQGKGLLGRLIRHPQPVRLADLTEHPDAGGFPPHHPPMTSFLGVPVRVRGEVFGNLYLTDKRDGGPFTGGDEHLAVALAAVAGVAVENSRLHARVSELAVIEDRERIARQLHDTVIQRIFSIGLALEGIGARVGDDELAAKLRRAAADLDDTVQHVRTTVFNLDEGAADLRPVRSELTDLVEEVGDRAGVVTSIRFEGDVDRALGTDAFSHVTHQVFGTLRDALVALGSHHGVDQADVVVAAGPELVVRIETDAAATDLDVAGWLEGPREAARRLGGRLDVVGKSPGTGTGTGTELVWTVPLDPR